DHPQLGRIRAARTGVDGCGAARVARALGAAAHPSAAIQHPAFYPAPRACLPAHAGPAPARPAAAVLPRPGARLTDRRRPLHLGGGRIAGEGGYCLRFLLRHSRSLALQVSSPKPSTNTSSQDSVLCAMGALDCCAVSWLATELALLAELLPTLAAPDRLTP